ncbi:MAG: ABC transporter permease [Thermoanaerobaculia bacterium]|nr:ABC transporter permease [Thermoanaerobaculia bacterium]
MNMDDLLRDLRTSWRSLRRRPAFSFTIVATLAIALGANTAVFTLIRGIAWQPLPFIDDDGLVTVAMRHAEYDIEAFDFSVPDVRDFAEQCTACSGVGAYDRRSLVLGSVEPERIWATAVSPGLLALLGVDPAFGRHFQTGEDIDGADGVILLGHDLWQDRMAGDPDIVGRTLVVNGRDRTVIGVMPEGFSFPEQVDAWIPLVYGTDRPRGDRWIDHLVARLDPAITLENARAEVSALGERLATAHPESNRGYSFDLLPYRDYLVDDGTSHALDLMMYAVVFVLMIACANVAHLMIVRDSSRRQETAVRFALGTTRWQLFRQRLVEGLILASGGTLLGMLLVSWAIDFFLGANPYGFPYWMQFKIDPQVLFFAAGLAIVATLLFTVLPLHRAVSGDPTDDLRDGARGSGGAERQRLQRTLVFCESALAVLLLFGAFLLFQSMAALTRLDPGFETERLVLVGTYLHGPQFATDEDRGDFAQRAAEQLASLPGIESAAAANAAPLARDGITIGLITESMDSIESSSGGLPASAIGSSSHLMDTLGIAPLEGRFLRSSDGIDGALPVAVVNQRLAERLWPDHSAVGRRIRSTSFERWFTVVGVVPDLYYEEAGEESDQSRYQVHVAYRYGARRNVSFLLRTDLSPAALYPMMREELRKLDATLPLTFLRSLEDIRHRTLWADRLLGQMLGAFATAALVLAALGLYGVMAFAVAERRREFGIRFALGADARRVIRQVLREGLALTAAGLTTGTAASLVLAGWISSNLYGITDGGTRALLIAAWVLLTTAGLACWLPARRAGKLDPISALRGE